VSYPIVEYFKYKFKFFFGETNNLNKLLLYILKVRTMGEAYQKTMDIASSTVSHLNIFKYEISWQMNDGANERTSEM
jgi:hypothetical protein